MSSPAVFISYAHRDSRWKDELVRHLNVLEKLHNLQVWVDARISPGTEFVEEIRKAVESSCVAVLLVSADFLGSEFILQEEIRWLLERRQEEGLRVLPILIRDCLWEEVPWLAPLQVWPRDGRPLSARRGNGIDAELKKISQEILRVVRHQTLARESYSRPN